MKKSEEFEKVYPRTTGSVIAGGLESLDKTFQYITRAPGGSF